MEIELVNFIARNSTLLSFIFGTFLLAVNYVSSNQAQKFQDKSIASQAEAKKFQDVSLRYQQEAKDAQDKNTELIRDLLENASNPDLLGEKLLELRTEWLNKMSENKAANPSIDHILKAVKEIKREQEEVEVTREENLSTALRHHELFAIPIWNKVSDIFYQRALLLQNEGVLKNVKKHTLEVDETARESFYGQTHDIKDLVSATIVESGKNVNIIFIRELYPMDKDPKSKFASRSSFVTTKKSNQIVLNVTKKVIRASSPQSEMVIPTEDLADNMAEFTRIVTESFDDYMVEELSR
ncbi:hypothetical protein NMR33_003218 [Vibrio cholerae]|uniref:hypothetical protein n=1 Tax=Vibrio TaxID=662 RepID=UPI00158155A4|nr:MULTISPECIES: hypothetical protein [Vibrio]EJL6343207.1 hypothetical protein [Vibrio cholerae]MBY7667290.1 hypothetical protein [Vibrio anguillarum]QKU61033.1 hypothetical protein HPY11_15340 [Vibrio cholerae]